MAKNLTRGNLYGIKHRVTRGIPVGCQLPCADNSGAKTLNIIAVHRHHAKLNRLPSAGIGDVLLVSVRKGKPELKKKPILAVVVRQRKSWRRMDGNFIYCEDNAGVIINNKGETKGSSINGPVAKECADLFPKISANAPAVL